MTETCNHEFMPMSWKVEKKTRQISSLICRKCLLILDEGDLIKLQNTRAEMRRLAREKAKEKAKEMIKEMARENGL